MAKYAQGTTVNTSASRDEIERTLQRYGANGFMYATEGTRAVIAFKAHGRHIRFILSLPDPNAREFHFTAGRNVKRTHEAALKEWEQACRQKWRALALVIKAKLEAIDAGISVFEDEFMANIILPDGRTVSEFMTPQIEAAYETGEMPKLLPYLD